ncbi:SAM-dependent methyltransferase [Actinomadura xylanilytica]|uniref:SAM-dependent methyltransferase n=1 Tax=Actinomadura xylanilytica TaxID=887459 RepID=UPI00255AC4EA|nr:SAM-dependent methyltransferase [Actinomadura xylanilytica]MDL4775312.1 SAM-dependent methyltransferase [Actinomadura xylanilytica]
MQEPRRDARPGIDPTTASVARMYDYYLHGKDNFQIDRDAADRVAQAMPEIGLLAQENRSFLRRSVRYMARQGIRQFLDIGSGLPTAGNTHEIAEEITPDARVVYVDSDPVVLAHGRALLATNDRTTVAQADMHRPREVLDHPETAKLINFDEPVGVLMIAMIHFLTLDERAPVISTLRDALAPGSFLSATHVTREDHAAHAVDQIEAVYATTPTPIYFRSRNEIAPFFEGFTPVDPGLVTIDQWNPESDQGDAPAEKVGTWLYGAVGRKD